MANSDRKLTFDEVMCGNVSSEYLDKKERIAIITRHIRRLVDRRFDIDDKISVVGERDGLVEERQKISDKINKLQSELRSLKKYII